jgi:amidohydrolase
MASTPLVRRVKEILPEVLDIRHALHSIPETHFGEHETAALIRKSLGGSRVELVPPLMETDTVGLLRGGSSGPCVLLRADVDALPVVENTGAPWSSTHAGVAHACGHDGHSAILIGVARVLSELADELAGSVRFVFQPAEEEACGGRILVEKGLLDMAPRPVAAFALHGWVGVPVGMVCAAPGPAMAGADRFLISVTGKGGHAALPHRAVDPVITAAQVVTGLQSIVSRSVDPLEAAVVSVCRIEGGHSSNVIPDQVVLEGTARYFDTRLQSLIRERMDRIIAGICAAGGCEYTLSYSDGYIPLVNDREAVQRAREAVTKRCGPRAWSDDQPRSMGAEDFGFYLAAMPGALLRLGLGEQWPSLHSAEFDFNDQSIETGILTLAGLALDYCERPDG